MTSRFDDHPVVQRLRHWNHGGQNPTGAFFVQTEHDFIHLLEMNDRLAEENERLKRVVAIDAVIERIDRIVLLAEEQGRMIKEMMGAKE
jgi:hypothetical protein